MRTRTRIQLHYYNQQLAAKSFLGSMLTTATLVSEVRDVALLEDYQLSKLHNQTNEIHTRAVPNPIPTGCLTGGVKYSPAPSGRPAHRRLSGERGAEAGNMERK